MRVDKAAEFLQGEGMGGVVVIDSRENSPFPIAMGAIMKEGGFCCGDVVLEKVGVGLNVSQPVEILKLLLRLLLFL